jgi:hypothetical protein
MTYTNELEVEIDFSDVDPNLLQESKENAEQSVATVIKSEDNSNTSQPQMDQNDLNPQNDESNSGLGNDEPKPSIAGRAARFFRKKN